MRKCIMAYSFILMFVHLGAQSDTLTLSANQFLQIVRLYHPVIQLSDLNIEKTKEDIRIAKGAFNPILSNYIANKKFDNSTYYDYINPNISIPTWFGGEIVAGVENLSGVRFDPSETVGQSSYIGVGVPLLKNLIIDKRRAFLKQSKLFKEMASTEKNIIINNILLDAITQYWEWANAYQVYEILNKNYENSKIRFEFVKKTVINGERPAIDTIEALLQYQNFEFQKNEYWQKFQNEGFELSTFLWKENQVAYQLPANVLPNKDDLKGDNINTSDFDLEELLQSANTNHPELMLYRQKSGVLSIEKRLKFQDLLPKLDFKYNHLSKGYNFLKSDGFLFQNNFQYGLKFEMPLFFGQARGEYNKTKLKILENNLYQTQKSQVINQKIRKYFNDYVVLKSQLSLQNNMLENFKYLLKAEETLFKNGESSLFLINSRESKVFEIERKIAELKTKYFITIYGMKWSAGMLN